MRRDECLKRLARHHTDQVVVAVYQAAFEWVQIRPHPLNYISTGAMGQASSHALGLALGRPDKRVIVIDGDGSLLMNLGSLVTIAGAAPPNLHHFVFENGVYEVNGGHPIPAQNRVDFAALARAAGYPRVVTYSELDDFAASVGEFLRQPGPAFALMKIVAGDPYPRDYACIHGAEAREKFRRALRSR